MEPTRPNLPFIPVQPYARILEVLAERGHPRGAVLASAGLGVESFGHDAGYLSLPQMEAIVQRALALEPEIASIVGARLSLMSHGPLSVAALSAATIGEAIAVVAEHFTLVCPMFEIAVRSDDDRTTIRLLSRFALAPEVERYHTTAIGASLRAHVPRLLFGGALPSGIEIDVAHAGSSDADDLGVAITFDQMHHELRVPTALMAVRIPLADEHAHRSALRDCEARRASQPNPSDTAATVRRVLLASGPPFLDLVGTARRLATSSRSLRRRLRDEGTSFRLLLDEVRSSLADAWLDDPRRSITEIGLDLGYTDAANFTRAYRRAKGLSPSAARKQRFGLQATA